jgi:hypothetical protein
MTDESVLRDALHRATATQPPADDRVGGAFARVTRRRQRRTVVSCAAVVGVALAAVAARGPDSTGLRPANLLGSPSSAPAPGASGAPGANAAAGSPTPNVTPTRYATLPPRVPGTPSPGASAPPGHPSYGALDVYFLLDATLSMKSNAATIDAAIDGIQARMARTVADVRWGIGVYRDTPAPTDTSNETQVYRRVTALGTARVHPAQIQFSGGNRSESEATTMGLDGSIGIAHAPFTLDGQEAGFRPGVRRLIVVVTDAGTNQGTPYPTIAESVANLDAADVTVVAVQVLDGNDPVPARRDLDAIAKGTHGVARAPVDCDGDGQVDLRRGDPLVCATEDTARFDPARFADAVVALRGP